MVSTPRIERHEGARSAIVSIALALATAGCSSRHADLEILAIHTTFEGCPFALGQTALDRFVPWQDASIEPFGPNMTADDDPIAGVLTLCVTPGVGSDPSCQAYDALPWHDTRQEEIDLRVPGPDGAPLTGVVTTAIQLDDVIHVTEPNVELSKLTWTRRVSLDATCAGSACDDAPTGSCIVTSTVDASTFDDLSFARHF